MSNVYWEQDPIESWEYVRWSVYRDGELVAKVVLDNATTDDPHPYSAHTVGRNTVAGHMLGVYSQLGDALAAALK